jgi:hypothetical protein
MSDSPAKIRVQFDFAAEAYKDLSDLQEKLQASTKAEAVRYAIRTLQWVVTTIEEGKTILVDDEGILKEIAFPFIAKPIREEVSKKKFAPRRTISGRKRGYSDELVSRKLSV